MFFEELLRHFFLVLIFGGFFSVGSKLWAWVDEFYFNNIVGQWIVAQEHIFLRVYPPSDNKTSLGDMEKFFTAIGGVYYPQDPIDYYVHGTFYDTFSLEYHSIGGKIGFFIRTNRTREPIFKSALEARFPGSKIVEAPDPLGGLPSEWTGEAGPYKDFCAADLQLQGGEQLLGTGEVGLGNDLFPLKDWKEFQRDYDLPVGDPLNQLLSVLEGVPKDVHVVVQMIVRAYGSENVEAKVKARWKEELEIVKAKVAEGNQMKTADDDGNMMLMLVDDERERIDEIVRKINGQIFQTKIRVGILSVETPARPIFNEIFGYFKHFSNDDVELYPPRKCRTWVKDMGQAFGGRIGNPLGSWFGKVIDPIYWERERYYHEKFLYGSLKGRAIDMGLTPKHHYSGELASIFHFPLTLGEESTSAIFAQRISGGYGEDSPISVSSKPPSDLPT